jgi:hypothetical protein
MYYLRFTADINSDIERGCSYHYSSFGRADFDSEQEAIESVANLFGCDADEIVYNEAAKCYCQELPGLCAFALSNDLDEALEMAEDFSRDAYSFSSMRDIAHIVKGQYCGDVPEGDIVCNVVHVGSVVDLLAKY